MTVPLVYLLASRLYGWRAGLVAGALLAVSSWSITFSRFGMASMAAVALDVAIVLCLVLGLRTGRFLPYAAGGVLLGLNLQGYFLARLLPIVLLLVVAHFAIRSRHELWNVRYGHRSVQRRRRPGVPADGPVRDPAPGGVPGATLDGVDLLRGGERRRVECGVEEPP